MPRSNAAPRLYVIQFPSGRWGYVGAVPTLLGTEVPASKAAVMGGRVHRNAKGELVECVFPAFETETEARSHAAEKGFPAA